MSQNDTPKSRARRISPGDIWTMAARLHAKHGATGIEVAQFFAEEHRLTGDPARALAWAAVSSGVADIAAGRAGLATVH